MQQAGCCNKGWFHNVALTSLSPCLPVLWFGSWLNEVYEYLVTGAVRLLHPLFIMSHVPSINFRSGQHIYCRLHQILCVLSWAETSFRHVSIRSIWHTYKKGIKNKHFVSFICLETQIKTENVNTRVMPDDIALTYCLTVVCFSAGCCVTGSLPRSFHTLWPPRHVGKCTYMHAHGLLLTHAVNLTQYK